MDIDDLAESYKQTANSVKQAKAAISYFVQERERIKREKRIELIKEVVAAILAVIAFVDLLALILCLKYQSFDWLS